MPLVEARLVHPMLLVGSLSGRLTLPVASLSAHPTPRPTCPARRHKRQVPQLEAVPHRARARQLRPQVVRQLQPRVAHPQAMEQGLWSLDSLD